MYALYSHFNMSKTPIPKSVKAYLWWKSAGRCEFRGCNEPLYLHGITMDNCNISNCAHIIADSPNGPRGTVDSASLAKDPKNIMLMCPECHKYIDDEGKDKYDAETLFAMKQRHEARMEFLTGLKEDLQANVVTYGAKIADHFHEFSFRQLQDALLPNYYPANKNIIELGCNFYAGQDWERYWKAEEDNLVFNCNTQILNHLDRWEHKRIALFAIAPMPLLVRLGTLLNNKHDVEVFQKQRRGGWKWPSKNSSVDFIINRPTIKCEIPVLVLSLSSSILERVRKIRKEATIWEITIVKPNPDFMQSKETLYRFGRVAEIVLDEISKACTQKAIDLYMSAPVSCAIEFGRVWMQKANSPLSIYDYDKRESKEDKLALTIKK